MFTVYVYVHSYSAYWLLMLSFPDRGFLAVKKNGGGEKTAMKG